jgi:hypothetical protein
MTATAAAIPTSTSTAAAATAASHELQQLGSTQGARAESTRSKWA